MTYNMAGEIVEEITWAPGTDAIMGNADDVVSSYFITTYAANGARVTYTLFSNPGPDTIWKTSDDQISSRRYYDTLH
jgi:hypothetical protein